jgi:hypothetical protein
MLKYKRNIRKRINTVCATNFLKQLPKPPRVTLDMLRKTIIAVSTEIPNLHTTRRP